MVRSLRLRYSISGNLSLLNARILIFKLLLVCVKMSQTDGVQLNEIAHEQLSDQNLLLI